MLKNGSLYLLVPVLLWVLIGCTKSFKSESELTEWIKSPEYAYKDTASSENYFFEVRWLPNEFFILQEQRILNAMNPDSSEKDTYAKLMEIKKSIGSNLYFQLTVRAKGNYPELHELHALDGPISNREWLQKLMFGLKKDIFLISGSADTTKLAMYQMENIYGIKASKNFLLVFPRFNANNPDLLEADGPLKIKIKEFGQGSGKLTFTIPWPPRYTADFLIKDF